MFRNFAILLNVLALTTLVMIHFSSGINPLDFWPFAFLGLVYPLILISCVFFALFWLFGKLKAVSVLFLFALILTWSSNEASFQMSIPSETLNEISLMSWNVKNFDLYNWSGNENSRNEMLKLLEEERPNILCLQEFYTEDKGKFTNLKEIKNNLDYKHHYFAETYSIDGNRHWGMIIFSDYKIINTGKLTFKKGTRLNTCMYVDIALSETQAARVYNVHFQSNQFSEEDYNFLDNLNEQESGYSAMNIVNKLKTGYMNRAEQVQQVLESKTQSPYPTIICGDFNGTPVSYAYKTLSQGMQDAFIEKGTGFGKTYVNPTPFLRIDFSLFHPMFTINGYEKVSEIELSDHYPIRARFTY